MLRLLALIFTSAILGCASLPLQVIEKNKKNPPNWLPSKDLNPGMYRTPDGKGLVFVSRDCEESLAVCISQSSREAIDIIMRQIYQEEDEIFLANPLASYGPMTEGYARRRAKLLSWRKDLYYEVVRRSLAAASRPSYYFYWYFEPG